MNKVVAEGLTFDDVLIIPRYSEVVSRNDGSLDTSWTLGQFKFDIPIISSNMTTVTGAQMALKMAELGGLGVIHRFMSVDEQMAISDDFPDEPALCHSVGSWFNDEERITTLVKEEAADIICIDIAHGNSIHMEKTIEGIRKLGFTGPLIAGNIALTGARVLNLANGFDSGPLSLKIGIGPGSVCTTRIKTGCGVPQLTAIMNNSKFHCCADGGIRSPGDVAKALAAGANNVMIGGMLAGTDNVPGYNDQPLLYHAGNASSKVKTSFNQHNRNAEGVAKPVEKKGQGSTEAVIDDIMDGVKSAMAYVGAFNLEEFQAKAQFIRVTSNTVVENHPHF